MCSDAGSGTSVPAFQKRQNWGISSSSVGGAHIKVQSQQQVVAIAFSPDQLCDVFQVVVLTESNISLFALLSQCFYEMLDILSVNFFSTFVTDL